MPEAPDARVKELVEAGDIVGATTIALRALGPEVMGFILRVLGSDADAEEVFAATSERLWRSFTSFSWRCSLRTWIYVLARGEIERFRDGARRRGRGRVGVSEIDDAALEVSARSRWESLAERQTLIAKLREELPDADRVLLVLRVDRELPWEDIALVFLERESESSEGERKREAARLRKRFQLVKERLAERVRAERGRV